MITPSPCNRVSQTTTQFGGNQLSLGFNWPFNPTIAIFSCSRSSLQLWLLSTFIPRPCQISGRVCTCYPCALLVSVSCFPRYGNLTLKSLIVVERRNTRAPLLVTSTVSGSFHHPCNLCQPFPVLNASIGHQGSQPWRGWSLFTGALVPPTLEFNCWTSPVSVVFLHRSTIFCRLCSPAAFCLGISIILFLGS